MLQVGEPHPDRNEQFEFINSKAADFLEKGLPVISVDAKKKENIGNFKNNGEEYRKQRIHVRFWTMTSQSRNSARLPPTAYTY